MIRNKNSLNDFSIADKELHAIKIYLEVCNKVFDFGNIGKNKFLTEIKLFNKLPKSLVFGKI